MLKIYRLRRKEVSPSSVSTPPCSHVTLDKSFNFPGLHNLIDKSKGLDHMVSMIFSSSDTP